MQCKRPAPGTVYGDRLSFRRARSRHRTLCINLRLNPIANNSHTPIFNFQFPRTMRLQYLLAVLPALIFEVAANKPYPRAGSCGRGWLFNGDDAGGDMSPKDTCLQVTHSRKDTGWC
jgi:hypothetical protein